MAAARERVGYVVLGVGIGGFVDGIVLHQVLQWHHLWSARTPATTLAGLEENTVADGLFHLASLAAVVAGLLLIAGRRLEPGRLVALALVGWGLFHILDQLVFHLALEAHHIRMVASYQAYDWSFFAVGLALVALGLVLERRAARRGSRPATRAGSSHR